MKDKKKERPAAEKDELVPEETEADSHERHSSKMDEKKTKKKNKKKKRKRDKTKHIVQNDEEEETTDTLSTENPVTTTTTSSSSSWGQAFAMASSVEPISLGNDFKPPSGIGESGGFRGNIGLISQIARDASSKLERPEEGGGTKRKSEETSSDSVTTETEQKKSKKKKKKRKKTSKGGDDTPDDKESSSAVADTSSVDAPADPNLSFPYPTDPDDHCESPSVAYDDILPILDHFAKLKTTTKEGLAIYDPYYCNGAVLANLAKLGYTNVYNKKEDCYRTWSSTDRPYPECDVFLTNPPYSADHVEKLMHHLTSSDSPIRKGGKAWCLLMPNYVHKKDFYKAALEEGDCQPFYLVPKKRYVYLPPKDFREKKNSDVHKKSSPFVSMWYIWGGSKEKTNKLIQAFKVWERKNKGESRLELARSKSALRDLRRKK